MRVEVEWRGSKRWVVARLEQWLDSGKAVVVCSFEEEEEAGPFIIVATKSGIPYSLDKPRRLIHHAMAFDVVTRQAARIPQSFKPANLEKMNDIIRRAFVGEDFTVARPLELNTIAAEPRLALCLPKVSAWVCGTEHWKWSRFRRNCSYDTSHSEAQQQLLQEWAIEQSNTRFAWEWATLSREQRLSRIGWRGDKQECYRLMRLILTASSRVWESGTGCSWSFDLDGRSGD